MDRIENFRSFISKLFLWIAPVILLLCLGLGPAAFPSLDRPGIEIHRDDEAGKLSVYIDGGRAFTYQYSHWLDLPHYWPVYSPSGKNMLIQQSEPYPHHRSFYVADTVRLNGSRKISTYNALYTGQKIGKDAYGPPFRDHVRHTDFTRLEVLSDRAVIEATSVWEMDEVVAPGFSTGMPISRSGIDLALHDLTGKLQDKSLAQMWGKPKGGPVPLSWTVNVTSLDDTGEVMGQGKKRGYRHFNIKVAPDPEFDAALARKVRRLAPGTFLWADANGGYDPDTALEAAARLADAGVDVLDGVAMKPARCGGLLSCKRQIELCLKNDLIWLDSGLTDPDISLAAALGLYGAFGLKTPAALNGPQFLTAQVLKKPLRIENGMAHVPEGPGPGIEVDEEKVVELMKRSGGDKLKRFF